MSTGTLHQTVSRPNRSWTLHQAPRLSTEDSASERHLFGRIRDRAPIDSAACSSALGFRLDFEQRPDDAATAIDPFRWDDREFEETSDDAATAIDPFRWDDREFEEAPRSVLRALLLQVLRDPDQRGPLTERLFPHLLKGQPARRRLVYETLRWFAEPQDVLIHSLLLFSRYGDAEPLAVGAGLLGDLGAQSWQVLEAFSRTGRPECAYFVTTIAGLGNVEAKKRLDVMKSLARSDEPELRWRILEALNEFSLEEASPVLETLARDGGPEDAASSAAKERLGPTSEP